MALDVETRELASTPAGDLQLTTAGRGERPLLVLTPMVAWMTAALPAGLGDRFTLTLLELAGPGAATVDAITEATRHVADRLDEPVLFGHSMNGALALAAAAGGAPCAGVIAVTPPAALPPDPTVTDAYWGERAEPERRRRARAIVEAHEATTDATERSRLQAAFTRLRRWYDLDLHPTELDARATLDEAWITSVFESGTAVDWTATFAQVPQPVLLALGTFDFVAPPTAWTADLVPPAATVEHFERSGHTPYYEEPDEFLRVVDRWTEAALRG
jgi:pimeloyl-ACP methyl ester carboxylesterase